MSSRASNPAAGRVSGSAFHWRPLDQAALRQREVTAIAANFPVHHALASVCFAFLGVHFSQARLARARASSMLAQTLSKPICR